MVPKACQNLSKYFLGCCLLMISKARSAQNLRCVKSGQSFLRPQGQAQCNHFLQWCLKHALTFQNVFLGAASLWFPKPGQHKIWDVWSQGKFLEIPRPSIMQSIFAMVPKACQNPSNYFLGCCLLTISKARSTQNLRCVKSRKSFLRSQGQA